jgi:hypothetical protein
MWQQEKRGDEHLTMPSEWSNDGMANRGKEYTAMRKITRMADSYDLVYERRRLERFDLEVPAKIEVLSSADMVPMTELLTKDICAGGAYFPTKTALPPGTKVKLDILLPLRSVTVISDNTRGLIKVNGTVIRSGPAGMAIGFDGGYLITPFREAMN